MRTETRGAFRSAFVFWAAGIALSGLACAASVLAVRRERQREAELEASKVSATVQLGLVTPSETLHALRAFLEALDERGTSLAQFRAFSAPAVARHPEIVALEWIPSVPGDLRGVFEQHVRRDQPRFELREPTRAGDMVRAVDRPQHLPLVYSEPLTPSVHGLDLAFEQDRSWPAVRALATGRTTLSNRYQLLEDPDGVYSVVAYEPVHNVNWLPGLEAELKSGVIVGLFRLESLFERALRGVPLEGMVVDIEDPAAPSPLRLLFRRGTPSTRTRFESDLKFFDRTYRLAVVPRGRGLGAAPWLVLAAGLLLTATLRAYDRVSLRARSLESRVAQLGQYAIEGEIARGGMGTVYRAHHAFLRRPTAIKIAHTQGQAGFEREARITCALNHPNTVQVYDFGRGEGGTPYLAMEFIEGFHLEELVRSSGPLPPARAGRILMQAAGSLAEAHERGLIHRDVKPRNIMLTERGGVADFVKVLDFGLARSEARPPEGESGAHLFQGTPGYTAPEVVRGARADVKSDVFSLGCVAYYLLAGRHAFDAGGSQVGALAAVVSGAPAALPATVPPSLERLVTSCISKDPRARPDGMQAFMALLRAALADCAPWTQADAEAWWREHPPAAPVRNTDLPAGFSVAFDSKDSRVRFTGRRQA